MKVFVRRFFSQGHTFADSWFRHYSLVLAISQGTKDKINEAKAERRKKNHFHCVMVYISISGCHQAHARLSVKLYFINSLCTS